jgi:hypothetical protein
MENTDWHDLEEHRFSTAAALEQLVRTRNVRRLLSRRRRVRFQTCGMPSMPM